MIEPNIPPIPGTGSQPPPASDHSAQSPPVANGFQAAEALLREPARLIDEVRKGKCNWLLGALFGLSSILALVYGLVLGSFSGGTQWWASPVKSVICLVFSAVICFPSLYVFACLSGARAKIRELATLLVGMLAIVGLLLLAFAPVAWLFSQSTESIVAMGALHLVFGAIAFYFGFRFLELGLNRLNGDRNPVLRLWSFVFVLVVLQMTTSLRPLLGKADSFLPDTKRFFLQHWASHFRD